MKLRPSLVTGSFAALIWGALVAGVVAQEPSEIVEVTTVYSLAGRPFPTLPNGSGAHPDGGLLQANDGSFYGTTMFTKYAAEGAGTIFKVDAAGLMATVHYFDWPRDYQGPLVQATDGSIYGTRASNAGTIFKLNAAGVPTTVHTFSGGSDGFSPGSLLQASDGNIYGMTTSGGLNGVGTIFKLSATGTPTTLHAFSAQERAAGSLGPLFEGSDGQLYGTIRPSIGGGKYASDRIFKLESDGTLITVHDFSGGSSGGRFVRSLVLASDGYFYGTMYDECVGAAGFCAGYWNWNWTFFRLDQSSGVVTTLHTFAGDEGTPYLTGLVEASDGSVYGMTATGCSLNPNVAPQAKYGTIFRLDTSGVFTTLHTFTGVNGKCPQGALIQGSDGDFYGTTLLGGIWDYGSVFRLSLDHSGRARTALSFSPRPSARADEATTTFSVKMTSLGLMSNENAIAGKVVSFTLNDVAVGSAVTDDLGQATLSGVSLVSHIAAFPYAVKATFAGNASQTPASVTGGLFITQLYPVVVWPTPADMVVGTPLGAGQLNATANVPGIFTYRVVSVSPTPYYDGPAIAGTMLGVGTYTLSATFVPADSNRYYSYYRTVALSVKSATAVVIYPSNGATNADLTIPIQWTTVPTATYSLIIGSTPGASDLLNTGEILQTSRFVNLPAGQKVYARLCTKVAGVWRCSDSSFSAAIVTPTFTYPTNGATDYDVYRPLQWTAVPNAQAYKLQIGSTVGASNFANTGEIQQTQYWVSLPGGQTFYARAWAKVGGVWRYTDISFSPPLTATIWKPANGATNAVLTTPMDPRSAIRWSAVPAAQAYYLYVGSTIGAKDLVNSGETLETQWLVNLPGGQTLYARLWTRVGGVWRYVDSSFSVVPTTPVTATITYPANGATDFNMALPIQWTTVLNAQAYYLYVGSTAGASDFVNTGEIQQTSKVVSLPAGRTVYARMWTKFGGVWRFADSSFSTAPIATLTAILTYPVNGTINADVTLPMQWTTVPNVQAYYLYVGSTAGASNLVNTGEIQQTSRVVNLPSGQTVHARMWAKVGGVWRYTDSSFTTQ